VDEVESVGEVGVAFEDPVAVGDEGGVAGVAGVADRSEVGGVVGAALGQRLEVVDVEAVVVPISRQR
jgi:hypothetical protein